MSVHTVQNFDENRIPVEGSATFRADATYVWTTILPVIKSMNTAIAYFNSDVRDTNDAKNTTLEYRNDTQNFRSESLSARDRAESAANRAEAVIIPDGATYSFDDLESALNGLLTTSVAQQAQISILKGD